MNTATSAAILGAAISTVTLVFNAVVQGVGYLFKYWLGRKERKQSKQEESGEQLEKLKEELYFLLEAIKIERGSVSKMVYATRGLRAPEEKEIPNKIHEEHPKKLQRFWYVFEVKFAKSHLDLKRQFEQSCNDTLMDVRKAQTVGVVQEEREPLIVQAFASFEKVKQVAKAIEDAAMQCVLSS